LRPGQTARLQTVWFEGTVPKKVLGQKTRGEKEITRGGKKGSEKGKVAASFPLYEEGGGKTRFRRNEKGDYLTKERVLKQLLEWQGGASTERASRSLCRAKEEGKVLLLKNLL